MASASFRIVCSGLLATLLITVSQLQAGEPQDCLALDNFDLDIQNNVGGWRSTFQRAPSKASHLRVTDGPRGTTGRCVRVTGQHHAAGFCGFWMHFFDFRQKPHTFLDAADFKYLSFFVRGQQGGESFLIRLMDDGQFQKESSVSVGPVEGYLTNGVTTAWQEVVVPLRATARLDVTRLAGMTLEFHIPGSQVVYIDDVTLKSSRQTRVPLSSTPERAVEPTRTYPRCLWVWNTARIIQQPNEIADLIQFARHQRIESLWLQLPYKMTSHKPARSASCEILLPDRLRRFLKLAHRAGLSVHALDGAPEFVVPHYHHVPLAVIDAVIAFNLESQATEATFDGVHFDNEPYLLPQWISPTHRTDLLQAYLTLNAECQRKASRANLVYGVDIPFWWDKPAADGGDSVGLVLFSGITQPVSYHCIDMLDVVGVMDYRNTADGADGIIAHGRSLLEYAEHNGGCDVYIGVETFHAPDTRVLFTFGPTRQQYYKMLDGTLTEIARHTRGCGLRLRSLDDGQRIHLGIEVSPNAASVTPMAAEQCLLKLARAVRDCTEEPSHNEVEQGLARIESTIQRDPEWVQYEARDIVDENSTRPYAGFVARSRMLTKTTFAGHSLDEFNVQIDAAESYFSRYVHYSGIAIHYYDTFQQLSGDRH